MVGLYILRRLLLGLPTMLIVSVIVFTLLMLAPGDAADIIGQDASAARIEALRETMHLNDPIPVQYGRWMRDLLTGDLGTSIFTGRPVIQDLRYRIPTTFELGILTLIFTSIIGIAVGVISAMKPEGAADQILRTLAVLGLSIPVFWIATLVLVVPTVRWGYHPPSFYVSFLESPAENLRLMVPAAFVLSLAGTGRIARMMRTTMLDIMGQDYMRTARAKGLKESTVLIRHGIRNALIPVITLLGLEIPYLFGGVVIIEVVFGIPGLGSFLFEAINQRDIVVAMNLDMFIAALVIGSNLTVDLMYGWLDPRIRSTMTPAR